MLRTFKADLHIHTCLSPCADLEMSPKAIVARAQMEELDIIGICDHNSAENVAAVRAAAAGCNVSVLPGLEITSQEEVHVLALFAEPEPAARMQEIVYGCLPGKNDEEAFGVQVVVNEEGEVLSFNDRLLIGASTLSIEEIVDNIHALDGLAIASHIDREGFSIIGQLGFIPENLELDALEISPRIPYGEALTRFTSHHPLTCGSDAHYLEDIGKGFTSLYMEEPTTREIKKALSFQFGRRVVH
ncbi:MAG: PHP domain-containing protein [Candidatus Eisenbacteria bacterium]